MRILWLRPSKGDNISVRRERIAAELRDRGHHIDIRDATGWDAVGAIKQAVTKEYDLIAGNVRVGLYLGYPLARILRKPILGDVSDPISDINYLPEPFFRIFEWYEWFVLNRVDAAVFVYQSTYDEATERGIQHAIKLPNAVDYEAFAEPEDEVVTEAGDILTAKGVDIQKPIAVYIGVFSPRYKIRQILATADFATDWEFVFIGEGRLEPEVQEAAQNTENVYFPGAFDYRLMPGFLSHADVGFCFKDAEQPLKLKEYGAAGIPTIVRPGELSYFYTEEELVFIKPEPHKIADTLTKLATDEDLYYKYAKAGRTIATKWSWDEIAAKYEELFDKIIEDV